jgi:hypothetical protein
MLFVFFVFLVFLPVFGNHISKLLHALFNRLNLPLDIFNFDGEIKGLIQIPCAEAQKGRRYD